MITFVNASYLFAPSGGLIPAPVGTLPGDLLIALLNEDSSATTPVGWIRAGQDTSLAHRHVAFFKIATGSDSITLASGGAADNGSVAAYRGIALPAVRTGDWAEVPATYISSPKAIDLPPIAANNATVIAGFALANGIPPTMSPGAGYATDYSVNVFGDSWAFLWEHSTTPLPGTVTPAASFTLSSPGTDDMWGQAFVVGPAGGGLSMMM